ncbi:MAG: hypothetical protein JWN44_259 [Myxococcales bacterium]|nr:hypothetical protein [Myxococcales bacterium]
MKTNLKLTAFATLTAFAFVAGCSAEPEARMPGTPAGPSEPATPQGPGEPIPQAPAPKAKYAGVYSAIAPLDLTQKGVLPGVLGPTLDALTNLKDHPGKAVIELIIAANISPVSGFVDGLPGIVKTGLEAALDYVIKEQLYKNVAVLDQIATIVSGIADLSKTIEIHNSLTIHTPAADGTVNIEQQVTDVGFRLLSKSTVVAFNANEKKMAFTGMPGALKAHANAPVADADLTLGGGKMTLPFGELLLQAAGPLLFSQFGGATDLAGALKNLLPIHDLAVQIAGVLPSGVSVATIESALNAGVGILAGAVTNKINEIVFKDVQVSAGAAVMLDVSQALPKEDYQSDRIAQGKWDWSFTVAGTTVKVPSVFEGDRIGDAQ